MKQLKSIEDRTEIFILEALRFSLLWETNSYTQLLTTLTLLESAIYQSGTAEDLAASAFNHVWSMIDMVHRAKGLFGQVTGLKQKDLEFQRFRRVSDEIEQLRHLFQHLNSNIQKLPKGTVPALNRPENSGGSVA